MTGDRQEPRCCQREGCGHPVDQHDVSAGCFAVNTGSGPWLCTCKAFIGPGETDVARAYLADVQRQAARGLRAMFKAFLGDPFLGSKVEVRKDPEPEPSPEANDWPPTWTAGAPGNGPGPTVQGVRGQLGGVVFTPDPPCEPMCLDCGHVKDSHVAPGVCAEREGLERSRFAPGNPPFCACPAFRAPHSTCTVEEPCFDCECVRALDALTGRTWLAKAERRYPETLLALRRQYPAKCDEELQRMTLDRCEPIGTFGLSESEVEDAFRARAWVDQWLASKRAAVTTFKVENGLVKNADGFIIGRADGPVELPPKKSWMCRCGDVNPGSVVTCGHCGGIFTRVPWQDSGVGEKTGGVHVTKTEQVDPYDTPLYGEPMYPSVVDPTQTVIEPLFQFRPIHRHVSTTAEFEALAPVCFIPNAAAWTACTLSREYRPGQRATSVREDVTCALCLKMMPPPMTDADRDALFEKLKAEIDAYKRKMWKEWMDWAYAEVGYVTLDEAKKRADIPWDSLVTDYEDTDGGTGKPKGSSEEPFVRVPESSVGGPEVITYRYDLEMHPAKFTHYRGLGGKTLCHYLIGWGKVRVKPSIMQVTCAECRAEYTRQLSMRWGLLDASKGSDDLPERS